MDAKELHAALGPLASLYEDENTREIMVDGPDKVYAFSEGELVDETTVRFNSPDEIRAIIDAVLHLGGVELDEQDNTIAEIRLTDGARFNAAIPPTAVNGPCLTIRKFPAKKLTWENLIEWQSLTAEIHEFMQATMQAGKNVLVSGGPASGKTTLANMFAELIPPQERLVVVEDTHSLRIDHPRIVYLEAAGPPRKAMADLLKLGTGMFPNRLIVGELSGPEALYTLQAMNTGYSGMTLIHATSPEDALARLESMCIMANLGLGLGEIRSLIASAIDLVTYQEQLPAGNRKLTQIAQLKGLDGNRYNLEPIFRYDPSTNQFIHTGYKPDWIK